MHSPVVLAQVFTVVRAYTPYETQSEAVKALAAGHHADYLAGENLIHDALMYGVGVHGPP